MDEDLRAFWVQASPPDGVQLAAASVWQMTVRPRGTGEALLDVEVRTRETGWGACPELDDALSERGMRRSHGWGDGPRRSLVAWLREPSDAPVPASEEV